MSMLPGRSRFFVLAVMILCFGGDYSAARAEGSGKEDFSTATATVFRIPIRSSGADQSTTATLYCGIPFPETWKVGPVAIMDGKGQEVPSSSRIMARWPESDAIRWLGVEFQGDPSQKYFAVPATAKIGPVVPGVEVTEEANVFVVVAGTTKFILPKVGALIGQAYLDRNGDGTFTAEELLLENTTGDDLYAIDQDGTLATIGGDTDDGQLRYETSAEERPEGAPVLRAVFRREGWYVTEAGVKIARHITRLIFEPGAGVKVAHSFIFSEDTNKVWFTDYGLRLNYAKGGQPDTVFFPASDQADAKSVKVAFPPALSEVYLFQEKAFYMSRMDLVKDCHFQIGTLNASGQEDVVTQGSLAGNWILAGNAHSGVGIALRNFWQTFPKELNTTHEAITLHLWSARGGSVLDLRTASIRENWPNEWYNENYASKSLMARIEKMDVNAMGLARSHDFVIALSAAPDPQVMAGVASRTQTPTVSLVDPAWLRFSEAMGRFAPYSPEEFPEEETFAAEWFDQHMDIWRQWGDYGFLEFGNWPHVWYRQATKGPLEGRWHPYVDRYSSAMDYGTYAHLWRMFARTGQRKYFDAAEETTRERLDLNMVHWDGLDPGEPFKLGRYDRFPNRVKGIYTTSNSPVSWGEFSGMHHSSGTDLRALAYWYYLTDHRPAMEMIESYHAVVKKVWDANQLGPLRGSRPFAILKNLATVYQETGDPEMKPIIEEQVKYLVDLEAPQGVAREVEATGLAKYGVKAGSLQRAYEVTKDPLAAQSLIRGATTWATTSVGHLPMRYYDVEGELFATAYDLTKDPILLRAMLRDMKLTLSNFRAANGKDWDPMYRGVGPSASSNIYPLGGIAFAMDAISRYEAETGEKVELTPFARQGGYGDQVLAALEKPVNKEIVLDVRSIHALSPTIFDAKGEKAEGVIMEPFLDQLYTLEKAATRWKITLPDSLPAGTYFVNSGYGGAMWEVTWTNAEKIVLYAPESYLLGTGGGTQWPKRVMATQLDHRESVYFMVPKDTTQFEISSVGPVEFLRPEGEILALPGTDGRSQVVEVAEKDRGKLWTLRTPELTFVTLQGVPPFMAYGDPERFFLPEVDAGVLAKLLPTPPSRSDMPAAGEDLYASFDGQPGEPAHGVILTGQRRLSIASAPPELISPQAGTLEFWVMPYWNSVDQLSESGKVHALMDGGSWTLVFHRYGEMSATATVEGQQLNAKKPLADAVKANIETNAGAILKTGRWSHVALQWKEDGGTFTLELYVNGRQQHYGPRGAGMATSEAGFTPAKVAGDLLFGGDQKGRGDLDAILAGLRFSETPRYTKDFDPRTAGTLKVDPNTTALFLFDDNVKGSVVAGKPEPTATVLNP